MRGTMLTASFAAVLLVGSPAPARQTADAPPVGETKLPDGTTAEERANTARLNAEQAARARSENVIYAQEVSAAQQQVAHDRQVFAEETAAYEAEKARVAAMSAAERMKWEADVAACKAGDTTRCAPPVKDPPQ